MRYQSDKPGASVLYLIRYRKAFLVSTGLKAAGLSHLNRHISSTFQSYRRHHKSKGISKTSVLSARTTALLKSGRRHNLTYFPCSHDVLRPTRSRYESLAGSYTRRKNLTILVEFLSMITKFHQCLRCALHNTFEFLHPNSWPRQHTAQTFLAGTEVERFKPVPTQTSALTETRVDASITQMTVWMAYKVGSEGHHINLHAYSLPCSTSSRGKVSEETYSRQLGSKARSDFLESFWRHVAFFLDESTTLEGQNKYIELSRILESLISQSRPALLSLTTSCCFPSLLIPY
jgi:hypothetical protein